MHAEDEDEFGDDFEDGNSLTDAELHAFLDRLFPQQWDGADVMAEIAPDGWEQSPLAATQVNPRELIGLCIWDVFSDNHDVVAADGRVVHLGTFRGTSEFLDKHIDPDDTDREGMASARFYMGSHYIWNRADLTPIYAMIFRRLKGVDGDWVWDPAQASVPPRPDAKPHPNEPLALLNGYRRVYGRNPRGWPWA